MGKEPLGDDYMHLAGLPTIVCATKRVERSLPTVTWHLAFEGRSCWYKRNELFLMRIPARTCAHQLICFSDEKREQP